MYIIPQKFWLEKETLVIWEFSKEGKLKKTILTSIQNKCSTSQNRFIICIFSTPNKVSIFCFKIMVSLKFSMLLYHFRLPGWSTSNQWRAIASECVILFSCESKPFYFSWGTMNECLGFLNLEACVCVSLLLMCFMREENNLVYSMKEYFKE